MAISYLEAWSYGEWDCFCREWRGGRRFLFKLFYGKGLHGVTDFWETAGDVFFGLKLLVGLELVAIL